MISGGACTLFYLLQDHLGSTVEVLDASLITYAEMKYWPYGASRSTTGAPPSRLDRCRGPVECERLYSAATDAA